METVSEYKTCILKVQKVCMIKCLKVLPLQLCTQHLVDMPSPRLAIVHFDIVVKVALF